MPPFMVVIIVIVVLALVVYGILAAAKRRKELAAWAGGHGLSFDASHHRGMDDEFDQFDCLDRGHSRYACNVMAGAWAGLPIRAFDYHYTTGSGKNRQHHSFSAVIVRSPIPLRPLYIRREGFFDKVTEFFGYDDIDFESAEFSRTFYVKSPDKRWAYDVIHQRMMEYLLAGPRYPIQFDAAHIITWGGGTFSPREFQAAAELLQGMIERFPEYLVRQQSG